MARRRVRRWLLLAAAGLVVAAGVLAAGLVESGRGQRVVLDFVLARVRGALAGSLTVDSIRSPGLLGGAVLVGVHLEAEGGRPFLDVDSVRVRYSALRLVAATPRIAGLTLYGPHVRITRYAGEDRPNVARLFTPGPPADSAAREPAKATTSARTITFANVTVEDGLLEVLSPADGAAGRQPTVPAPDGEGRLRRLGLERLAFALRDVELRPGSDELLTGRLADLSMVVSVLDRPFRVERGGRAPPLRRRRAARGFGHLPPPRFPVRRQPRVGPGRRGGVGAPSRRAHGRLGLPRRSLVAGRPHSPGPFPWERRCDRGRDAGRGSARRVRGAGGEPLLRRWAGGGGERHGVPRPRSPGEPAGVLAPEAVDGGGRSPRWLAERTRAPFGADRCAGDAGPRGVRGDGARRGPDHGGLPRHAAPRAQPRGDRLPRAPRSSRLGDGGRAASVRAPVGHGQARARRRRAGGRRSPLHGRRGTPTRLPDGVPDPRPGLAAPWCRGPLGDRRPGRPGAAGPGHVRRRCARPGPRR